MTLRDLTLRVRALFARRRVEQDLDEELAFHIDRETAKHIASGLSASEARTRARARFGPVPLAADRCRDARGTALVDTLVRDVLYAFRMFRRAPLASLTIVATVALGLGLVTVVFTYYNALFLTVDAVRNPHELFAVKQLPAPGARARILFTWGTYDTMHRETSIFDDTLAMVDDMRARIDGRPMRATLVTGNFFQMLGVTAAIGRTLTPADDERSVIVLSHDGWIRLFAGEPTAVGRRWLVNGVECEIVGVMPAGFRGLRTTAPDGWAPVARAGHLRPAYAGAEDTIVVEDVIGRLKPGMSPETAAAGLTLWAEQRGLETAPGRPVSMALEPPEGTLSQEAVDALMAFVPLFFAFGLILMIGCANVANLLLARGISRQREIGIRLSLGASRGRIVRQLLTESVLLALAAAGCGFAASRVFLAGTLYAVNATMPPEAAELVYFLAPVADWRVVVFLLGAASASTVVFGLAPALHATRLELVRTMRGEMTKDVRPGRARNALIAIQVGASAVLLVSAAVFLRGAAAASRQDLGLRASDTVVVDIANEPRRPALLRAITAHPSVAALAAVSRQQSAFAEAKAETPRSARVDYMFVSPEYFSVLEIPVLKGRSFTASERTVDAGVAVVSKTVADRLWPDGDAVGQVVRLDGVASSRDPREPGSTQSPSRTFTVVGVARNVRGSFLVFGRSLMFEGVYLPEGPESPGMSLMLRVHGDPGQARLALLDSVTAVDPAPGGIQTLRTMTGMQRYVLGVAFSVTVALGAIALGLTLSGLFSVLSYLVEQRRKEIGVRMALGATTRSIARLVLSQSLRPVGGGLVAGVGLAVALAIVIASLPVASLVREIVQVFDPVAYGASLLVIVIACVVAALIPAIRATRIDPIAALRED